VILVGYDNEEGAWIAQNSWGSEWGDNGFFKVEL
jgi:C1A family cysteine protease